MEEVSLNDQTGLESRFDMLARDMAGLLGMDESRIPPMPDGVCVRGGREVRVVLTREGRTRHLIVYTSPGGVLINTCADSRRSGQNTAAP